MIMKKITAVILAALSLSALCACGAKKDAAPEETAAAVESKSGDDPAVFTIGDKTMSKSEFEAFVKNYTQSGYDIDSAKENAKKDATNSLAMLALQEKEGIKFSDEELADMKSDKESLIKNVGGEDGYKQYLDTLGITDGFFDKIFTAEYVQRRIFADETSDEAVKAYFNDNYLRAKHILLATMDTSTQEKYDDAKIAEQKALCDELLARAQGGEDFDALVSQYSEDPGSKSQPDGYFFTAGQMVPEFENTTRSLGMNEIGLCQSDYGYHIIKRLPLDEDAELYEEQISADGPLIKQTLIGAAAEKKIPELLKKHGMTIETDESVYDSITE